MVVDYLGSEFQAFRTQNITSRSRLDNSQSLSTFTSLPSLRCFSSAAANGKAETSSADSATEFNAATVASKKRLSMLRRRRRHIKASKQKLSKQKNAVEYVPMVPRKRDAYLALFDSLASHHALSCIDEALDILRKLAKSTANSVVPLITAFASTLHTSNSSQVLQIQILEFLLSTERKAKEIPKGEVESTGAGEERETYFKKDHKSEETGATVVQVYKHARERALEQELLWKSKFKVSDRVAIQRLRLQQHREKSDDDLEKDAVDLVDFLKDSLTAHQFDMLAKLFQNYTSTNDGIDEDSTAKNGEGREPATSSRKRVMRKLSTKLERATGTHFALVATKVASFFYMDDIEVSEDDKVLKAKEKWKSQRDKFADILLRLQELLVECMEEIRSEMSAAGTADPSLENIVAGIRKNSDLDPPTEPTTKPSLPKIRQHHLVFDAMVLHEATEEWYHTDAAVSVFNLRPSENIVFVDNLPIDMSISELEDLYQRCGTLQSVQIFNQRPDLDPGPLNRAQLRDRVKRQVGSVSLRQKRWQRPRTPVYGILQFEDSDGYRAAVDDSLRTFGIVVRKHPMRSIRASEMTRLYVESVPAGIPGIDFEYMLSQLLKPEVFVSLDVGQDKSAIVGSCEIKFPSFEIAWESYQKLQELEVLQQRNEGSGSKLTEIDHCTLNWMRTPKDAKGWWSRHLGFE